MNKVVVKLLGVFFVFGILTMCKKDAEPIVVDGNTSTAFVHSYMENASNDIDNMGEQAGNTDTTSALSTYRGIAPSNSILSICALITVQKSDTSNTDTLTIDFGNSNCVCGDGKTRNGKLQYVYAGGKHYRDSGIVITCTPLSYFVEGSQISGVKHITNRGLNTEGNLNWYISESLTLVKVNNGGTVTWNSTRNKELLNTSSVYTGSSNPINWSLAKIGINGTASGVTDDGRNYVATITEQLERDFSCSPSTSSPHKHPFIKGKVDFKPGDKLTRTINYGNGTCDLSATILLDGSTYNFGL